MRGSAIQLKVLGDMAVAGGLRVEEVFETRSGGIAVDGLAEAAGGPAACDPHGVRFSGSNLQLKTAGRTESASGVAYGGAAENRTPVHDSSLIGISRLSHSFSLGHIARSDTLSASQPVRS